MIFIQNGIQRHSFSKVELLSNATTIDSALNYIRNKQQDQGTGLGLYISKSIVEAHGGNMWAENNTDGKEALFTLLCHLLEKKNGMKSLGYSSNNNNKRKES